VRRACAHWKLKIASQDALGDICRRIEGMQPRAEPIET
jgi:hypothetical protein